MEIFEIVAQSVGDFLVTHLICPENDLAWF
jgi:hypothetical protein